MIPYVGMFGGSDIVALTRFLDLKASMGQSPLSSGVEPLKVQVPTSPAPRSLQFQGKFSRVQFSSRSGFLILSIAT